ncbi:hypothetical protein TIFTF001_000322 [Ficus carica]|uniref:Uncharacterized protein n=1 Tax=Ficus carica TaxID=3494 RepID=A0AA88CMX0_FICCA|nr:hypothetical protein TIFTF001_000322 [Ficus carica]
MSRISDGDNSLQQHSAAATTGVVDDLPQPESPDLSSVVFKFENLLCSTTLTTAAGDPFSSVASPRPTDLENQWKIGISSENLALPDGYPTLPVMANHHATPPPSDHQPVKPTVPTGCPVPPTKSNRSSIREPSAGFLRCRAHRGDCLATSPLCWIWTPFAVGRDLGCLASLFPAVEPTVVIEQPLPPTRICATHGSHDI